ncbi:MAG: MarR family EPS-associated transcriptional regulator [Desulfobacter sp.]|nr:MAG: MarR family EPS-associated transcriptional regulator [Desulfobacter sp.]
MNASLDDEIKLKLLSLLKDNPSLTQREMSKMIGVSLGKINYCISAIVQTGLIRIEQFKNTSHKNAYLYHITPIGLKELTHLILHCLKHKLKEYEDIKKEIKILLELGEDIDADFCNNPELLVKSKGFIDFSQ